MKFRLVDKITSWSRWQHISGIKAVSFEEYSLKDAFGENPRLPEALLLESFLQLGNWLVMLSSDFQQMGMVARISEVRFHGELLPGQRLHLEARLVRRREEGFEMAGHGLVNGRIVISGLGCLAYPAALADYLDPDDMRMLFSEICEPASPQPGTMASLPAACLASELAVRDMGATDL